MPVPYPNDHLLTNSQLETSTMEAEGLLASQIYQAETYYGSRDDERVEDVEAQIPEYHDDLANDPEEGNEYRMKLLLAAVILSGFVLLFFNNVFLTILLFLNIITLLVNYHSRMKERNSHLLQASEKAADMMATLLNEQQIRQIMMQNEPELNKPDPSENNEEEEYYRYQSQSPPQVIQTAHSGASTDTTTASSINHTQHTVQKLKKAFDADLDINEIEEPVADFFPSTTIFFADIAGFTAWSSTREPHQIFYLLERIYAKFDKLADQHSIFKVETVGDCYVAVAGMHEERDDHADLMCTFADQCLRAFEPLVKDLEVDLGPDTADLSLRIGIHSGPVTAGILRGENSRFQLFGDTMNTTARIESSGAPNAIHVSRETANLLAANDKGHWLIPREDKIQAKGKGELQTYWLEICDKPTEDESAEAAINCLPVERRASVTGSSGTASTMNSSQSSLNAIEDPTKSKRLNEKTQRLVNWLTELMVKLVKNCKARRNDFNTQASPEMELLQAEKQSVFRYRENKSLLSEMEEIIVLPPYTPADQKTDPETMQIDRIVVREIHEYVETIANMYRSNAFHNFEHASHVTMSVVKLLHRIVSPEGLDDPEKIHEQTYGITSDPITQFAVVWASIVHDVDHDGVTNAVLVQENNPLVSVYDGKSVAEQNSIDLAWDLLMDDRFMNFRRELYVNVDDFKRLRSLVVNSVLATDIMDKELGGFRKARWAKAFSEGEMPNEEETQAVNRKATIVLEHLIQASDVSHTMQHWHVYQKFNKRLFQEMYTAYKAGRIETNPADNWYKGEIGFFDFYIIPLAKKLAECGVFGVSSDEYLNYAVRNREEWEQRGEEIVHQYVKKYAKDRRRRAPQRSISEETVFDEIMEHHVNQEETM